jgi:hypothetical protein
MTSNEASLLRRLAWLCDELRAGNQFADAQLIQWAEQARRAAQRALLTAAQEQIK